MPNLDWHRKRLLALTTVVATLCFCSGTEFHVPASAISHHDVPLLAFPISERVLTIADHHVSRLTTLIVILYCYHS